MTIIPETGGSPTFTAKSPTFNASGLTFSDANVDHEAAQAHAFVGIGFGAALATSTNETVYPFTGPWR
jgi:hypothetical protein